MVFVHYNKQTACFLLGALDLGRIMWYGYASNTLFSSQG